MFGTKRRNERCVSDITMGTATLEWLTSRSNVRHANNGVSTRRCTVWISDSEYYMCRAHSGISDERKLEQNAETNRSCENISL